MIGKDVLDRARDEHFAIVAEHGPDVNITREGLDIEAVAQVAHEATEGALDLLALDAVPLRVWLNSVVVATLMYGWALRGYVDRERARERA